MNKEKLKKGVKTLNYYLLCQLLNPTNQGVNPYENSRLKYSLTKKLARNNTSAVLLSIEFKVNESNYGKWLARKARVNKVEVSTLLNTRSRVVVLLIGDKVALEKMVEVAWKGKNKTRVKNVKEKWFNKKIILYKDGGDDAEISWSPGISNSIKYNLGNVRDILDNPNYYTSNSVKESQEIEKAAQENGLFAMRFSRNIYVASPGMQAGFLASEPMSTSANKREITDNKVITKDILLSAGVPVPQGIITEDYSEAKNYLDSHNKSIVAKPLEGSQGRGVSVDIQNQNQLKIAWDYAKGFHEKIILEEMVIGTDIRILVFGGEALVAQIRVPAHIVGDGKHSVEQLIDEKNNLRLKHPRLDRCLIKKDAYSYEFLKRQNHSLSSVPKDGEIVFLHLKANLSAGGDNVIITEKINPDLMRLAEEVASTLDMDDFLGVDLLVEDILLPRQQQDCRIIEVNSRAELRGVQYPLYGPPFQPQNELIKRMIIEKDRISEFVHRKSYIEITGCFDSSLKSWISDAAAVNNITQNMTMGDGKAAGTLDGKEDDLYRFLVELMDWKSADRNMFIDGVIVFEDKLETKPSSRNELNDFKSYISDQPINTYVHDSNNECTSNMELVLKELNNNGYNAERLTNELISIQKGERTGVTGINPNTEFANNACNKVYPAKKMLMLSGLPVLRGIRTNCRKRRTAYRFLEIHENTGVITFEYPKETEIYRIESSGRLKPLCKEAISKGGNNLTIEEELKGIQICIAVMENQAVSAIAIEPPYIVGDGKSSIENLIDQKNQLRNQNPWYANRTLEINEELTQYIESAGYGINDIPAKGEIIQVGKDRYWDIDGDSTNISEILHEDFKRQAIRAVGAIPGLKLAYVHMVVENPTASTEEQNWRISRMDPRPAFLAFHYPWKGKAYNLAKDVALKLCIEDEVIWKKDKR